MIALPTDVHTFLSSLFDEANDIGYELYREQSAYETWEYAQIQADIELVLNALGSLLYPEVCDAERTSYLYDIPFAPFELPDDLPS